MKKVFALSFIFCLFFVQKTFAQNVLKTTTLPTGTTQLINNQLVLCYNGVPFTGTRGQVLDLEAVNLAQPNEKNVAILHEDGTGGCLSTGTCSVFKQELNGFWILVKNNIKEPASVFVTWDQNLMRSILVIYSVNYPTEKEERIVLN